MSGGKDQGVRGWVGDDVDERAQKRVYEQTLAMLGQRRPGSAAAAGVGNGKTTKPAKLGPARGNSMMSRSCTRRTC